MTVMIGNVFFKPGVMLLAIGFGAFAGYIGGRTAAPCAVAAAPAPLADRAHAALSVCLQEDARGLARSLLRRADEAIGEPNGTVR